MLKQKKLKISEHEKTQQTREVRKMLIVEVHLLEDEILKGNGYDKSKLYQMLDHVFLDVCGAEKIVDGQFSSVNDFHDFTPLMTAACLLAKKKDVQEFCKKILWVKRNEKNETYHVEDILEEMKHERYTFTFEKNN